MREEITKCDQCGKQSNDICGDENWIKISSNSQITFSVSKGRNENGIHEVKTYKHTRKGNTCTEHEVDFCSLKCMLEWAKLAHFIEIKNCECQRDVAIQCDRITKEKLVRITEDAQNDILQNIWVDGIKCDCMLDGVYYQCEYRSMNTCGLFKQLLQGDVTTDRYERCKQCMRICDN